VKGCQEGPSGGIGVDLIEQSVFLFNREVSRAVDTGWRMCPHQTVVQGARGDEKSICYRREGLLGVFAVVGYSLLHDAE